MLQSVTEAQGNGGLTEVTVPPYISKDHITVYVDYVPTTAYEWLDDQRIRTVVPTGKLVRVVRTTSPDKRLTVFRDGTVLGGDTLNVDSLQAFYMAQEARDLALLSGSAVGTPAPGTENTTSGLLALLSGSLSVAQLGPSLASLVNLIDASATTPGSVNARISAESSARLAALQAESDARSAALAANAQAWGAALEQEQDTRTTAVDSLSRQITTLAAAVGGATSAVQTETTARVAADNALGTRIDTVQSTLGGQIAEVRTIAETSAGQGQVNANYTIKVTARNDGKYAVAGIGLNATAPDAAPTQSELVFMADKFFFVPSSAGLNTPLTPLLTAGVVNGQSTTTFNSILWGDKTVPARVLVDGILEARHISAGTITADKLDTQGLTIKDALGNVVFGASTGLDYSLVTGQKPPGQITAGNASTYIANAAIGSAQVGQLTASNLTVDALSNTVNGGASSGGRVVISNNKVTVYDSSNAVRVVLGYLL